MRWFNVGGGAGLIAVWCFCVSSYVFGASTAEKRDVSSNNTAIGANDTLSSGANKNVSGLGLLSGANQSKGLNSSAGFGNHSAPAVGSVPLNGASNGTKNGTVGGLGSAHNLTGGLAGAGPNSTLGLRSASNSTNAKAKDEESKKKNPEIDDSKKNSNRTDPSKDTKSNSTAVHEYNDNGTNHTKAPATSKNATSDSIADNLLGGIFNRKEKNNTSQKVPSSTAGPEPDASFNWPNDQGSHHTQSKNTTKNPSTDSNSKNSSQTPPPSYHTSGEKVPCKADATSADKAPPQKPCDRPTEQATKINSTQSPLVVTTPLPDPAAKYTTAYWIPIFNFGDDFYFLTKKGYAKLVDFPPPVIYSFTRVPLRRPATASSFKPPVGQPRHQTADFFGSFFDPGSPNFADCYVDSSVGTLIPHSYFGSWVAVFNLETGWNLETYGGYVPLDLYGEEAPATYEFLPVMYEVPKVTHSVEEVVYSVTTDGLDFGLASWREPLVVED